jgi:PKD repeat protein/Cu/Ag efflux protein CusF
MFFYYEFSREETMKLDKLILFTILLFALTTGISSAAISMPPDTTSNIHLAQVFDWGISDRTTELGVIDYVWGASGLQSGLYNTVYNPYAREPNSEDSSVHPTCHNLAWFRANHPDWIAYKGNYGAANDSNIAYIYGDTGYVPLDIANSAVRSYLLSTYYIPLANAGYNGGIAFDNVNLANFAWDMPNGARQGHYATNGSWVQQYSGGENDAAYHADTIAWAQYMYTQLHANNVPMSINLEYDWPQDPADVLSIVNYSDVVMDENGFGDYDAYTGSTWLNKEYFFQNVTNMGKGLIIVNTMNENFPDLTNAKKQWCIASYLLCKGNHTYMSINGMIDNVQEYGVLHTCPEYNAKIGSATNSMYSSQNVYMRDFTNGRAIVNPSATNSRTVTLPANTYMTLYSNTTINSITLPAASAVVLLGTTTQTNNTTVTANWDNLSYNEKKQVTIDHTQVSNTNQNNFPMMFNYTDSALRDIAHGGYVTSAYGYDTCFYFNGTQFIPEIVSYNNTSGNIIGYVNITNLSASNDTAGYMYIGNANITTSQYNNRVWSKNYVFVSHCNNNTSFLDSTSNGNNGTSTGSSPVLLKNYGKNGKSLKFGANNTINFGNKSSLNFSNMTMIIWVNLTGLPTTGTDTGTIVSRGSYYTAGNPFGWFAKYNDDFPFSIGTQSYITATPPETNVQKMFAFTYNSSDYLKYYHDGGYSYNVAASGVIPSSVRNLTFGSGNAISYYNGTIDEAELLSTVINNDTMQTLYNNQNDPASFSSLGATESYPTIPVANFSANVTTGDYPLTVQFNDTSTGYRDTWSWRYGDGTANDATQNPVHTFNGSGTFNVTMGAGNGNGTTYVSKNIIVKIPPTITWSNPANITYGTALSSTQQNAYVNGISGALAYNPTLGTILSAGNHNITVTFTPSDLTIYSIATKTVQLFVNQATPTITWNNPANINYGTALSGTQLNAVASVPGNKVYTPPLGSIISVGTQTLHVDFTANDTANYTTASKNVTINVLDVVPTANFTFTPTNGNIPLTVAFTGTSTGYPTTYQWNFGDGTANDTTVSPTHIYNKCGVFTVVLTVSNTAGSNTKTVTSAVTVRPTANFTGTPTNGNTPLTVQFTDLSLGTPTSWNWNFGDGQSSNTSSPSHTYSSAGTYSVVLTVTNAGGSDTITRSNYISVSLATPTAAFIGSPTSGSSPLSVQFTDQSTGNTASWSWDFGDGQTSTLQSPSHTYTVTTTTTYPVKLTVTNAAGNNTLTKSSYITVIKGVVTPVANFTSNATVGISPMNVIFTDTSTNSPTSWSWNFGDGNTSTSQNPTHLYVGNGLRTVSLTATNSNGQNTVTKTSYINVTSSLLRPVPKFTTDKRFGANPLTVNFTDQSTNSPNSWAWNFGDGITNSTQNPTHIYSRTGIFSVSLVSANGAGTGNVFTKYSYIWVYPNWGIALTFPIFEGVPA